MRALFYIFILISVLASCKSIDKMVERGDYDQAFHYAIKKLSGKKSKKTDHIIGLEKAYHKLNAMTQREINLLQAENNPANWSLIASKYRDMVYRQNRVEAFLPLISKDGYEADFDFRNFNALIIEAEDKACAYHFENGQKILQIAELNQDRSLGRKAYDEFALVMAMRPHYNDVHIWRQKAHKAGILQVALRVNNQLMDFHSFDIEKHIASMPIAKFNKKWVEYGIESENFKYPDYIVMVDLLEIFFSPERERAERYTESKEVLVRTEKVKEKRDSVEVWIEKEIYKDLSATITEVYRDKFSELRGQIRIIDTKTKQTLNNIPVNIAHTFDTFGARYDGDKEALSDETKKKMTKNLEPFPSDFFLAEFMANNFSSAVMQHLDSFRP